MTTQQTEYFLQIFKTIGAPLVGAALSRVGDGQDAPKAVAQTVAELLTKSVQLGIDIGAIVALEKQGDKAESARIAATGMAGDMLGGFYALQGKLPEAADLQRITEGLRAVKDFSATFEASPEATLRLESIKAKGQAVDALQSQIQVLSAFVPVIEALTNFPLGADPNADMQAITQTLTQRVTPIAQALSSDDPDNIMARGLMAGAAGLYAQCHEAVGAQAAGQPLDVQKVWQRFDSQLQILEALARSIVPGAAPQSAPPQPVSPDSAQDAGAAPDATSSLSPPQAPVAPPPVPPASLPAAPDAEQRKPQIFSAPIKSPVEQMASPPQSESIVPPVPPVQSADEPSLPPDVPEVPAESVAPSENKLSESEAPPSSTGAANPMSFFSAKPSAEERPPEVPQAPEPPVDMPPVSPPPSSLPPQEPPESAPDEESAPPPAPPGNPMSFFTKKDQSEDGD